MFNHLFAKQLSRNQFLKLAATGAVCAAGNALLAQPAAAEFFSAATAGPRPKKGYKGKYDLTVARGDDPYAITVKAIEAMGGMARFVKPDSTVVIKPNMAWDRTPEQAANTNPQVVAALVDLCYNVGARRVKVFDNSCNEARRVYERSGIAAAAEKSGAKVVFPSTWDVVKMKCGYDSPMVGWPLFRDAVECDTFINVPIAKHHGLTGLTLSMKNLMGICSDNRGRIHVDIGRKLADLTDFISPDLTVIDAFRVLTAHGPAGGDLADVQMMNTVVAATDPVLADAYACQLMNRSAADISYIQQARDRGIGSADVSGAKIMQVL